MKTNRHLISKFLGGEMDQVQAADFEKALINDSTLRCEMNLYQEVDKALDDSEILALRSQLNALHEPVLQEIENAGKQNKRVINYSVSAASIVVLLGIGFFSLFLRTDNMNNYYVPYEMSAIHRSHNHYLDQVLQEALIKYDNKQYREAVLLFEKVLDSEPEIISAYLYAGISYMEIKEYNHAEVSFNRVINHNDNLFIEQAEWYIGFCYMLTGRKNDAIKQFEKIAYGNGSYNKKAKNILKKLI